MVYKSDKQRLKKLLMDGISLLCKNGLPVQSAFRIEATIGITLSEEEVVLVSFREVVQPEGLIAAIIDSESENESTKDLSEEVNDDECNVIEAEKENLNNPSLKAVTGGDVATAEEEETESWMDVSQSVSCVLQPSSSNNPMSSDPKCPPGNRESLSRRRDLPHMSSSSRTNHAFINNEDVNNVTPQRAIVGDARGADVNETNQMIKAETIDNDDCTFVKIEEGRSGLEPLSQDDWYQEVSEAYYNNQDYDGGAQRQNFRDSGSSCQDLVPYSTPDLPASRQINRRMQQRRVGGWATSGHMMSRSVQRQNVSTAASQNPMTALGICQSILNQSTVEDGRHVCHVCQASLSNVQTLRNHIKKTHLALKIERCRLCGESFRWASQLARHKKRHHTSFSSFYSMDSESYTINPSATLPPQFHDQT